VVYPLLWLGWGLAFGAIELTALSCHKGSPGRPTTLSGQVWWAVRGHGWLHQTARLIVTIFLAWLTKHLVS